MTWQQCIGYAMAVLLAVGALSGCSGAAFEQARVAQQRAEKSAQLKQLGMAYHRFIDANQRAPGGWNELQTAGGSQALSALETEGWIVAWGTHFRDATQGTAAFILARPPDASEAGGQVLMLDGSVHYLSPDQVREMLAQQNPAPSAQPSAPVVAAVPPMTFVPPARQPAPARDAGATPPTPAARPSPSAPAAPSPTSRAAAPAGDETQLAGGQGGAPFRAVSPEGLPLVGLRVNLGAWAGRPAIGLFEPLFSREPGPGPGQTILARDGYAVGGLNVDAGQLVHAVQIVFMRIDDRGRLDPSDSYESDWIGEPPADAPIPLGGAGATIVGVHGRRAAVLDAVGLVLDKP